MKKLLLGTSVALGLGLAGSAYSADLPMKAGPVAQPVVAPVPFTWTGFYIGGHGGYGWAREGFEHPFDPSGGGFPPNLTRNGGAPLTGVHDQGGIFGGQFGFNWQPYQYMVVGMEADISGTTIKGTETHSVTRTFAACGGACTITDTNEGTAENKIRDLGTLRGRIGFAWNNFLIYGTGGLAWGQVRDESSGTEFGICIGPTAFFGCSPGGTSFSSTTPVFSQTHTLFGWTAGAGLDWKWGNLILGVLYLHYDLGTTSRPINDPGSSPLLVLYPASHVTADAVTGRLSWLFTLPAPAPIMARY